MRGFSLRILAVDFAAEKLIAANTNKKAGTGKNRPLLTYEKHQGQNVEIYYGRPRLSGLSPRRSLRSSLNSLMKLSC